LFRLGAAIPHAREVLPLAPPDFFVAVLLTAVR
jgi:hypothetical protein